MAAVSYDSFRNRYRQFEFTSLRQRVLSFRDHPKVGGRSSAITLPESRRSVCRAHDILQAALWFRNRKPRPSVFRAAQES